MSTKGWNSLKPITAPDQMPAPIHWNPMSDDWKQWMDSHQVYNGESRFSKEMLDAMKAQEQSQRDQLHPFFGRPVPVEKDW